MLNLHPLTVNRFEWENKAVSESDLIDGNIPINTRYLLITIFLCFA